VSAPSRRQARYATSHALPRPSPENAPPRQPPRSPFQTSLLPDIPPLLPPPPPADSPPRAFLTQLHSDVVRLTFAHYDANGDGKIKGVDFANSIAAAADIKSVDKYFKRVGGMGGGCVGGGGGGMGGVLGVGGAAVDIKSVDKYFKRVGGRGGQGHRGLEANALCALALSAPSRPAPPSGLAPPPRTF
jgi:hypothetical protein